MQNEPVLEIDNIGTKRWYLNGRRHRVDGPAVEYADGDKFWYLDGKLHRTDGPAIEWEIGDKEWYLNGCRYYTIESWLELTPLSNKEKIKLRFKYAK